VGQAVLACHGHRADSGVRAGQGGTACPTVLPTRSSIHKNSALLRVLLSLSRSNSMVSTGRQRVQHLAQNPHAVELLLGQQQLFCACRSC